MANPRHLQRAIDRSSTEIFFWKAKNRERCLIEPHVQRRHNGSQLRLLPSASKAQSAAEVIALRVDRTIIRADLEHHASILGANRPPQDSAWFLSSASAEERNSPGCRSSILDLGLECHRKSCFSQRMLAH